MRKTHKLADYCANINERDKSRKSVPKYLETEKQG